MPGLRGDCEVDREAREKGLVWLVHSVLWVLSSEPQSCPFTFPSPGCISALVFPSPFGPGSSWLCHFPFLSLFSGSSVGSLFLCHFSGFGLLLCLPPPVPIPGFLSAQGLPAELPPWEACNARLRFSLRVLGRLMPSPAPHGGLGCSWLASWCHLLHGVSWAGQGLYGLVLFPATVSAPLLCPRCQAEAGEPQGPLTLTEKLGAK